MSKIFATIWIIGLLVAPVIWGLIVDWRMTLGILAIVVGTVITFISIAIIGEDY